MIVEAKVVVAMHDELPLGKVVLGKIEGPYEKDRRLNWMTTELPNGVNRIILVESGRKRK